MMDLPGDIKFRSGGKNGGRREGAGRPLTDSEHFTGNLRRETRIKVDRFAQSIGLKRVPKKTYWEKVISALLERVTVKEPEYLNLVPKG